MSWHITVFSYVFGIYNLSSLTFFFFFLLDWLSSRVVTRQLQYYLH